MRFLSFTDGGDQGAGIDDRPLSHARSLPCVWDSCSGRSASRRALDAADQPCPVGRVKAVSSAGFPAFLVLEGKGDAILLSSSRRSVASCSGDSVQTA